MLQIDHVIYGTRDLDATGHRLWEELGLASYEGGVHPQFGTGNRIVPLGDSYIEIMGVADPGVAATNPLGQFVLRQTAAGEGWIAWCLRTDDIAAVAAHIDSPAVPGHRERPDGGVVSWVLTGLELALADPPLPFFIHWEDGTAHPGAESLEHRVKVQGIARVEVAIDEATLSSHLGGATLPLRIESGEPGIRAVVLATSDGELTIS